MAILGEPTGSADVGALAQFHQPMNRLANRDCAGVVISSDLPKILHPSDRTPVSRQGRIAGDFTGAEADGEMIMYAAVH